MKYRIAISLVAGATALGAEAKEPPMPRETLEPLVRQEPVRTLRPSSIQVATHTSYHFPSLATLPSMSIGPVLPSIAPTPSVTIQPAPPAPRPVRPRPVPRRN